MKEKYVKVPFRRGADRQKEDRNGGDSWKNGL